MTVCKSCDGEARKEGMAGTGKVVRGPPVMVRMSCAGEIQTPRRTHFLQPAYASSFLQIVLSCVLAASWLDDHGFSFAQQAVYWGSSCL